MFELGPPAGPPDWNDAEDPTLEAMVGFELPEITPCWECPEDAPLDAELDLEFGGGNPVWLEADDRPPATEEIAPVDTPGTLALDTAEPPGAVEASDREAADEAAEVDPAPGPPPPWHPIGTEIGVAVTAGMGVVVVTVRARPGKAA